MATLKKTKKKISKKTARVSKSVKSKKSVKQTKKKSIAKNTSNLVVFIVNPAAANGKTATFWNEAERVALGLFDNMQVKLTESKNHATLLCSDAIKKKAKIVVAVGGDGTISEVAAAFIDNKGHAVKTQTKLALLRAGSGSDFCKTLGISSDIAESLEAIKNEKTISIDMGLTKCRGFDEQAVLRPFINIAEAGIGASVMALLEKSGKKYGWWSYQWATIKGFLQYKPSNVRVVIDDKIIREGKFYGLVAANGRYYGAGMKIAPMADIKDGYFDIVILGEASKVNFMMKMGKVRSGTHIYEKEIELVRGKSLVIESDAEFLVEADGELIGKAPLRFELLKSAIKVIVP